MQSSEIGEFETALGTLCAGYDVPVTKARKDAYWAGLRKMSLQQFTRVVEFALSEDGPEDLPTTKAIWKMLRQLRAPGSAPGVQTSAPSAEPDHLEYWANRMLLANCIARGGFGTPELEAVLEMKRELVADFCRFIREGDELATPSEFMTQWIQGLQRVSKIDAGLHDTWVEYLGEPEAQKPFKPEMGRPLQPAQSSLREFA